MTDSHPRAKFAKTHGDIIATVAALLAGKGYRFHEGETDDRPDLGMNAHWFTWSAHGMSACEVGDTFATEEEAHESALQHFFINADIPLHMGPTSFDNSTLRQACKDIEAGYAAGQCLSDDNMLDHAQTLSNLTGQIITLIDAAQTAESFISGFEGDELQEGIPEMLAALRAGIGQPIGEPAYRHREVVMIEGLNLGDPVPTQEDTPAQEWSGSQCPIDPDNFWIDDETGERVNAHTGERSTMPIELEKTQYGTYTFGHDGMAIHDPLSSDCGRFRYAVNTDSESIPEENGFRVYETGGGCTAWRREFTLNGKNVYMLVTDTDGTSHALEHGEPVLIGVYFEDHLGNQSFVHWIQEEGPFEDSPPKDITRQGDMPGDDVQGRLCDELEAFCKENNLAPGSADEMLHDTSIPKTEQQMKWLADFVVRWDNASDAGLI